MTRKGSKCEQGPLDGLWLPTDESNGSHFHAVKCNAHRLEFVPMEDAIPRIHNEKLTACRHCKEHHDLGEIIIPPRTISADLQSLYPNQIGVDEFPELSPLFRTTDLDPESMTDNTDNTETLALEYEYVEPHDDGMADVTETIHLPIDKAEDVLPKYILEQSGLGVSPKRNWESLKDHASLIEVERVVKADA